MSFSPTRMRITRGRPQLVRRSPRRPSTHRGRAATMRATSTVSSGASATTNRRCSAGATQRVLFYRGFFRTFWRDDLLWGFARRDVFDDEDALAGLDQAELTPGDLLDRRGI